MKVSVIVPVYGVEAFIENCLASVGNQRFDGEIECIVVDDRGPDRSMDLARKYISEYQGPVKFNMVEREKNGGLSAARNSGLDVASGEYVYFLDSDDELLPDAIMSITQPLKENRSIDLVVSPYIPQTSGLSVEPLKIIPGTQLTLACSTNLMNETILDSFIAGDWFVMAQAKLYRREFLEKENLRFAPGLIHEDELWSFQVASRAKSMTVTGDPTYLYKLRPGSITTVNKDYEKVARNKLEIFCGICDEVYSRHLQHRSSQQDNLQRWMRISLNDSLKTGSKRLYIDIYKSMRERVKIGYFDIVRAYGLNLRQLVRNIHWLLPSGIASKLMWNRALRVSKNNG